MTIQIETINDYLERAVQSTAAFLPHLVSAIITLIVGVVFIKLFRKFMMRLVERKRIDPTLLKFAMDVLIWVFRALLFVSVITKLGVETSAFVAAIGAIGLAIGLSLQGSLANFAGGLLIILFKPLRVGDYIEAQGESGTVAAIFIFSTKIITPNNQSIYMPNGALSNGIIRNFSKEKLRRTDITLSVHHQSDLAHVKRVITAVIDSDKRILRTPEPAVMIKDLTRDAMLISVFVWATNENFGAVVSDFYQHIKSAFTHQGIDMPMTRREIVIANNQPGPESSRSQSKR